MLNFLDGLDWRQTMDSDEITEKLRGIFADVFSISEDEIEDGSSQDTIESWDSFQHLQLILTLEDAFGVSLTADEVTEMRTFENARNLLTKRGL